MKAFITVVGGLATLLALILAPALRGIQDEPVLKWHTYAGSSVDDQGFGIAMDQSGNIYVTGWSDGTWGNPINPHSGGRDVFVAKLNNAGELQWNTFLGSSHTDEGKAIAVDGSGNIYVVGTSDADWSIPGDPFPGGPGTFLAKLNSNGGLQWHKFMTTIGSQFGEDVAVDANGYVYVAGWGGWLWDTPPVEPHPDWGAPFVAKFDSSGAEVWHAFFGGAAGTHLCTGVAVDASGHVYVSGRSSTNWGTPVNGHAGDGYEDGFVAKLDSSGIRQWHTFFGGEGTDMAWEIAVDTSGNTYATGNSAANWGTPINPHDGGFSDTFVVRLDSSGVRQWHTFIGAVYGWDIAVDGSQNVYVTGVSGAHPGFVAALNQNGSLRWNAFLEGCLENIAVDKSHNFYVAGRSGIPWGTPVNAWAGGWDAFVAEISAQPTYAFSGFDKPVDNQPIVNNAKAGSSIPVKWQITDLDGTPISDPASFMSLTSYAVSCGALTADPIDEIEEYSAGASGLQYFGDGYWQFNWKTPKGYAGHCRIMVLKLGDGSEHTAYFKFK